MATALVLQAAYNQTSFNFSQFDYRFLQGKNYYKIITLSNLAQQDLFW
ncbi:hypothetical protein DB41_GZ00030 [Neochlamydia sp. TUME1]|nr:hypothetical protein DB41_GZ00030 [Neochlamydia sp. TUME1]